MTIAINILLLLVFIISFIGIIGEKDKELRKQLVIVNVVSILSAVITNR